jgi:hypothetical protein
LDGRSGLVGNLLRADRSRSYECFHVQQKSHKWKRGPRVRSVKATYVTNRQGLNFEVCKDLPAL